MTVQCNIDPLGGTWATGLMLLVYTIKNPLVIQLHVSLDNCPCFSYDYNIIWWSESAAIIQAHRPVSYGQDKSASASINCCYTPKSHQPHPLCMCTGELASLKQAWLIEVLVWLGSQCDARPLYILHCLELVKHDNVQSLAGFLD